MNITLQGTTDIRQVAFSETVSGQFLGILYFILVTRQGLGRLRPELPISRVLWYAGPMRTDMNDNKDPWWTPSVPSQAARRIRRPWRKVIAVLVILAIFYVVFAVADNNPGRAITVGSIGQVTTPPTMSALSVGCSGVTSWPDAHPDENGYLPDASTFVYRVAPAPYGNYALTPWTGDNVVGIFGERPTEAQAVNLEYHGWTVVWYAQDGDQTAINDLLSWGDSLPQGNKVLVAPWPANEMNLWRPGRVIILTKWETTEACLDVNDSAYRAFVSLPSKAPGVDVPLSDPGPKALVSTEKAEASKK